MTIFGPKPCVIQFGRMSVFRLFDLPLFYSLERRFFVVEYHKAIFLAYIAQKKKLEQWPFLHQIHGSILRLVELVVFIAQKGFFFVLEYHQRHFPGLYCLKKKKLETVAIFGPKPWLNPYGKMSIFRPFDLLVFIGWKGVFSF